MPTRLPFQLKRLRAALRERGAGDVVVKKRGIAVEPEELRRRLRLERRRTDRDAGADPDLGGRPSRCSSGAAPSLEARTAHGRLTNGDDGRTIRRGADRTRTPRVGRRVASGRGAVPALSPQAIVVSVLILITSGLGVINPLLIEDVFNEGLFPPGQDGPDMAVLVRLVVIMASITIIAGVIGIGQTYLTTKVGQQVMRDLRDPGCTRTCRSMSLAFFTTTRTGEIQSRIANDVGGVQSVVTNTASTILANVVTVDLHPRRHGHPQLAAHPRLRSWPSRRSSGSPRRAGPAPRVSRRATQESLADMSAHHQETLSVSGVLLAKVFGSQEQEVASLPRREPAAGRPRVREQMIGQRFFATVQSFFSITPADLPARRARCSTRGSRGLSAGTLVAFTTLQTRLYFPIGQLLQVSVDLRSSLALFDRIFDYLDLVPDIADAPDAVRPARGRRRAGGAPRRRLPLPANDRRRVRDGRAPPCRKVSIEVRPGQLVALVGPSGAGKTTISYLIPRLYDVSDGAVQIDGHRRARTSRGPLAEAIGFVTQESYLFHATIRHNLCTASRTPRRPSSRRRPGPRTSTTGSWSSPTATTPWSASGATGCPAGRSSGWPSPGCCCTTRAS